MKVPQINMIEPIKCESSSKVQPQLPAPIQYPQLLEQDVFQKQQKPLNEPVIYTNSSNSISFGYSNVLKTLFKEGEMPSVTHGIYGREIDKRTVTLEHLKPKSRGGASTLSNYALAHRDTNVARGNKPLSNFLNKEMLDSYLSQFNFNIPGRFDGFKYQSMITKTCKELGVGAVESETGLLLAEKKLPTYIDYGNIKDVIAHIDEIDISKLSKKMIKSLKNRGFLK